LGSLFRRQLDNGDSARGIKARPAWLQSLGAIQQRDPEPDFILARRVGEFIDEALDREGRPVCTWRAPITARNLQGQHGLGDACIGQKVDGISARGKVAADHGLLAILGKGDEMVLPGR